MNVAVSRMNERGGRPSGPCSGLDELGIRTKRDLMRGMRAMGKERKLCERDSTLVSEHFQNLNGISVRVH